MNEYTVAKVLSIDGEFLVVELLDDQGRETGTFVHLPHKSDRIKEGDTVILKVVEPDECLGKLEIFAIVI